MSNNNVKRPPFPFFHILWIVAAVAVIYGAIITILGLLTYGCGTHRPALMMERFTEQGDSAKRYFESIRKFIVAFNKRVEDVRVVIARIKDKYNGLREEICLVTNQIDDGLRGSYSSNVPEDEYNLPKDEQERRATKRKEKADKYIKDLKDRFSTGYNGIKLVECFADPPTEAEMAELEKIKDQVMEELNELDSNLQQAEAEFKQARGDLSPEQIAIYYTSLAYNDKYLKQLSRATAPLREGFEDDGEVLTFIPPKEPPKDINLEPQIRLPKIAERLNNIEKETTLVDKALTIYHNTIKKQKMQLKAFKSITTDEKEQRRMMDRQAGTITPAASA